MGSVQNFVNRKLVANPLIQFSLLLYSLVMIFIAVWMIVLLVSLHDPNCTGAFCSGNGSTLDIIALMIFFVILVFFNLLMTNRIVGPILRLTSHMKQISDGGPIRELNFRKKDHFHEVAEQYNVLLKRLENAEKRNSNGHEPQA